MDCHRAISAYLCLFAGLLLAGPASVRATQAKDPSSKPPQAVPSLPDLFKQAYQLAAKGQLAGARETYEQLLERSRAEQNQEFEGRALYGIGYLLIRSDQYVEGRRYLQSALPFFQSRNEHGSVGEISHSLANASRRLGDLESARREYRQAISAFESAGNRASKAIVLMDLSGVDGTAEAKNADLQEAVEIARDLGDKKLEGHVLHTWSDRLFAAGDFAAALEKLQQAIELFETVSARDSLPGAYTSMGRLLRAHGRPADAIPFFVKALDISREMGDKRSALQSTNAIAVAYNYMDDPAAARSYFEQALALAEQTGSPRLIDFARGGLAGNLCVLGEYQRAAELLEAILQRNADPNRSVRYRQLAIAYRGLGRFGESLAQAELAMQSTPADSATDLADALLERSQAHRAMGQAPEALADAGEVIRLLEQMRGKLIPADFLKQGFGERHQAAYSLTIDLHQRNGHAEKALEIAELARARAFLDLLATREVRLKAKDDEQLAALRADGENSSAGKGKAAGSVPVNSTGFVFRGHSAETVALVERLQKSNPELASFVSAQPETIAGLTASTARLRTTLLSYWVAPDAVYIWVLSPAGKVRSRRVEVKSSRLAELIRKTALFETDAPASVGPPKNTASIRTRGAGTIVLNSAPHNPWRDLHKLLIQPVQAYLPAPPARRLTIVPHGPLLNLSFAALQNEKGRYLLEDYAVHYVPAGALLRATAMKAHAPNPDRDYLIVADPELPPGRKGEPELPRLPGAREEARAIQRLLPAQRITLLVGAQASEPDVTRAISHRSVVHLATHGIVRDEQPLDSYLALGSGTGTDDGKLTVQEIYALDLDAELIVLSACRTGRGRATGEGIAALARAFFYAGTPSLIVTLWDVADEPSNRLLPEFYQNWLGGKDKALSLRAAQLRLLRELRSGKVHVKTPVGALTLPEHPVFWAGFALLGEP